MMEPALKDYLDEMKGQLLAETGKLRSEFRAGLDAGANSTAVEMGHVRVEIRAFAGRLDEMDGQLRDLIVAETAKLRSEFREGLNASAHSTAVEMGHVHVEMRAFAGRLDEMDGQLRDLIMAETSKLRSEFREGLDAGAHSTAVEMGHVHVEVRAVAQRLDEVGERLDEVGERLDGVGERLDGVGERLDEMDGRLRDLIVAESAKLRSEFRAGLDAGAHSTAVDIGHVHLEIRAVTEKLRKMDANVTTGVELLVRQSRWHDETDSNAIQMLTRVNELERRIGEIERGRNAA